MFLLKELFANVKGGWGMNDLKWGVQSWDISEAKYMLDEFLELYGERPLKNNGGGV